MTTKQKLKSLKITLSIRTKSIFYWKVTLGNFKLTLLITTDKFRLFGLLSYIYICKDYSWKKSYVSTVLSVTKIYHLDMWRCSSIIATQSIRGPFLS